MRGILRDERPFRPYKNHDDLETIHRKAETISMITSWYLSDLGEARGRQELFTKLAPQRLTVL